MPVAAVTKEGKEPDLTEAAVIPGLERAGPAQANPLWSRSGPPDPCTKKYGGFRLRPPGVLLPGAVAVQWTRRGQRSVQASFELFLEEKLLLLGDQALGGALNVLL